MKKVFLSLFILWIFWFSFSFANNQTIFDLLNEQRITQKNTWLNLNDKEIVKYLYDNNMTMFNDFNKFRPYDNILRSEVTKFFVKFAEKKWFAENKRDISQCNFKDVKSWKVAADLIWTIKQSCVYWLFNWNKWNFNPYWNITKWEALAVTIRMIEWKKLDESWKHFALSYYNKAKEYNLNLPWLEWVQYNVNLLNQPISRVDMWRLLEWAEYYKLKVEKSINNTLNYIQ